MGFTTRYVKRWKGGIFIITEMAKEKYFLFDSPCTNCLVRETCVQESIRVYTMGPDPETKSNLKVKMCIDALIHFKQRGWVFTDLTPEEEKALCWKKEYE